MLTLTGRVLVLISCLIGLAAVFWPGDDFQHRPNITNNSSPSSTCPLGFTSGAGSHNIPAGHPPTAPADDSTPLGLHRKNGNTVSSKPTRDNRYHLFVNATIWTGVEQPPYDSSAPFVQSYIQGQVTFAEAMLVHRGGILAVGSLDEVRHAVPPGVMAAEGKAEGEAPTAGGPGGMLVTHDLGGEFVMPGFVDAHVHLLGAGLALGRVDLRGAGSRAEVAARVAAAAAGLEADEWVLGGQWDETEWGGEMPTAGWLDEATGGRPAYLTRHDLHMGLANTAAMGRAGVGPHTTDPWGGSIDRDPATSRPTGLLRESAMLLVEGLIPSPSPDQLRTALAAASRLALSRGVTCVGDMGRYLLGSVEVPWRDLEVYLPAAEAAELPLRVATYMPLRTWRRLAAWVAAQGRAHPGGRLFWGALKEFADGSLGSRTALMWAPYDDAPLGDEHACGQRPVAVEELREMVAGAVGAGLQVAIHAIGDRAVDEVAQVYLEALKGAGAAEGVAEEGVGKVAEGVVEAAGVVEKAGSSPNDVANGPTASGGSQRVRELGQRLRLRIEHVQHLSGLHNATAALTAGGIIPVPNPLHLLTDSPILQPRLGRTRATRAFSLAAMLRAALRPALASDWPVVDLQPLTGVYSAVHRHVPLTAPAGVPCTGGPLRALPAAGQFTVVGAGGHAGEGMVTHVNGEGCACAWAHGTHPVEGTIGGVVQEAREEDGAEVGSKGGVDELGGGVRAGAMEEEENMQVGKQQAGKEEANHDQRLSLEAALLGHTAWGAAALGLEDYVGSLAPGRRADFILLSSSLVDEVGEQEGESGEGSGSGLGRGRGRGRGRVLSEGRLRRCLPVVVRTWVDGELVYDMWGKSLEVGRVVEEGEGGGLGREGARAEVVRVEL